MISEYLDYADEKKVRRALLTIATLTISVASVEILSGNLSLLGLKIYISQARLVALGQIACALVLFVFIMRSLPVYLELIKDLSLRRIDQKEKRDKQNWEAEWHSPDEPEDGPSGEFEQIERKIDYLRSDAVTRYSNLSFICGALSILIVDFGLPLAMGTIGTFKPSLISNAIDNIADEEPNIGYQPNEAVQPEDETKNTDNP